MNEKSLEQLLTEREALTDKLLSVPREGHEKEFLQVCNECAMHFMQSIQLVMNPTPEPLSFLAIFALRHFADLIAKQVDGAEEGADEYASLVDVESTILKFPHIKREEDDEEC